MTTVEKIMAWEGGEMDEEEEAAFFQEMVDSGIVWSLQGTYGRTAKALIDAGVVRDTHGVFKGDRHV